MPAPVYGTPSQVGSNLRAMECYTCGAFVPVANQTQHTNFHLTFSNRIGQDMSKVAWCDYGDHAYKAGEDGSGSFTGTEYVDGRPVDVTMDACSKHNPRNVQREAARYALEVDEYKAVTEND